MGIIHLGVYVVILSNFCNFYFVINVKMNFKINSLLILDLQKIYFSTKIVLNFSAANFVEHVVLNKAKSYFAFNLEL